MTEHYYHSILAHQSGWALVILVSISEGWLKMLWAIAAIAMVCVHCIHHYKALTGGE